MNHEAIILAGGLGTRLGKITGDLPKTMMPVNNKPFLEYILSYLNDQGLKKIILSVGFRHEKIIQHFGDQYKGCDLVYAVEDKPLGTGGAIRYALQYCSEEKVFILNGDTFFKVDLNLLLDFHYEKKADLTLCLKPLKNFDRYGSVLTDHDNRIIKFKEKEHTAAGNINGGIYILNKNILESVKLPDVFSFEKDFMEKQLNRYGFYGFLHDEYFIDIGVPEDYQKAIEDFTSNNCFF